MPLKRPSPNFKQNDKSSSTNSPPHFIPTPSTNNMEGTPPQSPHSRDSPSFPSLNTLSLSRSPYEKDWELGYQNYLSQQMQANAATLEPPSLDSSSHNHNNSYSQLSSSYNLQSSSSYMKNKSSFHNKSSLHRKTQSSSPDDELDKTTGRGRIRTLSGTHSSMHLPTTTTAGDVLSKSDPTIPRRSSQPIFHSSTNIPASKSEKAVRGGSIFKGMFRSKNSQHKLNEKQKKKLNDEELDKSGSGKGSHRRIQSHSNLQLLDGNGHGGAAVVRSSGSTELARSLVHGGALLAPKAATTLLGSGGTTRYYPSEANHLLQPDQQQQQQAQHHDQIRQQKIAFTEYHNSKQYTRNTVSAYLGDDKSINHGNLFTFYNDGSKLSPGSATKTRSSSSSGLPSVDEEYRNNTILLPITGPIIERIDDGTTTEQQLVNDPMRQFFIAPEILKFIPISVLEKKIPPPIASKFEKHYIPFEAVLLGKALGIQAEAIDSSSNHSCSSSMNGSANNWTESVYVLQQNYLLEFHISQQVYHQPRGYVFLQDSSISYHSKEENILRLIYHTHPSLIGPKREILFQLPSSQEAERWFLFLNRASQLTISDFYEFDASEKGAELGRGRYACVRPGRRRRPSGNATNGHDASTIVNTSNSTGILKKKPSFASTGSMGNLAERDYECALKIIDKVRFWNRVVEKKERSDTIVREIAVQFCLTSSQYPGFLGLKGFFETSDKIVLELELLDGIDLFRHLSPKGTIGEIEAAEIMYDLIKCIDFMQKAGIVHRDVKPANILMANKGDKEGVTVKLGDFGMATYTGHDGSVRGRCGTAGYVAPEILAATKNGSYGNKVDMFSAGVILYILLCGYEPFYGKSEKELIEDNRDCKVQYRENDWKSVSIEGRDLVEKMLRRDPNQRIEAKDAILHPWITRRCSRAKKSANPDMNQGSVTTLLDTEGLASCSLS